MAGIHTVLMCDDTASLSNSILGVRDNILRDILAVRHDDGLERRNGNGEAEQERAQKGENCEAHDGKSDVRVDGGLSCA